MLCFYSTEHVKPSGEDLMMSTGSIGLVDKQLSRSLPAIALVLFLLALSTGVGATQGSRDHVYLLRGAFNIFSLGMDEIAEKLQQKGVPTTVANYLSWSSLADQAAAEYKSGRTRVIILVGHSSGATAVTEMAAK